MKIQTHLRVSRGVLPETPPAPATDPHFASVVLLAGFEGADGSQPADIDESGATNGSASWSGAAIDTAQFRFGTSSLRRGASATDTISLPDSVNWNLAAGDFTIEFCVRIANFGTNNSLLSQSGGTNGTNGFNISLVGATKAITFSWRTTVPSNVSLTSNANALVNANQWYHVCVERSGSALRIYVDGVMVGKDAAWSTTQADIAEVLRFGYTGAPGTDRSDGWWDEVRITKGVARYASDSGFTPPTEAYPRA